MKKILFYTTCLVALILQGCTNEVDDLFDQSAQDRMNEELRVCKELLTSAENGWVLEYYPGVNQEYGGYTITMKFDSQQVTAASDLMDDPTETYSSYYSLKSDMGPTLNFDTYNKILHYWADPYRPEGGGGNGKGYEGDYEFIIMSHTDNEIVLKGKKRKTVMHMYKLEESSESYLSKIKTMESSLENRPVMINYFEGTVNGQTLTVALAKDRQVTLQTGDKSQTISYLCTAEGIHLYESFDVGGMPLTDLAWDDGQKTFIVEGQAFTQVNDPVYAPYAALCGTYTMVYYTSSTNRKEVTITVNEGNFTERSYTVEGLTFPLPLYYNEENDTFEILTVNAGTYYFAIWEVTGDGYLTWAEGVGLIGKKVVDEETQETYYSFVDNGVWGTYTGRALIIYSPNGWYYGFGGDVQYRNIEFHKQ